MRTIDNRLDEIPRVDRCPVCDGRVARSPYGLFSVHMATTLERPCRECGGAVKQCPDCREWLSNGWFRRGTSIQCTLCLEYAQKKKPWTDQQWRRLGAAARSVLTLRETYRKLWITPDMVIWNALESAKDHRETLIPAARAALGLWAAYFDLWEEDDLVSWRELLNALDRRHGRDKD